MRTGVLLLLLMLGSMSAQALRCNSRLANPGDLAFQVQQVCGDPFWVDQYRELLVAGEGGWREERTERVVEVWYYNFGADRLMQRVVFREGVMQGEESLGYGFDRPTRDCKLDGLPAGISTGEIIARCGFPQNRRESYSEIVERDGAGNAQLRMQRREDWVYDNQSRPRLLVMVDGRLTQTQRVRR